MPISRQEMKDRINRLYDEANKGNFHIFDELIAPNFMNHGSGGYPDQSGEEAFKQLSQSFVSIFPDVQYRTDNMVAEGNECAARAMISGTHKGNYLGIAPPTGKLVTWPGLAIYHFNEEGLMDARWTQFDGIRLLQQLGVIPAPPASGIKQPPPQAPTVVGGRVTSPEENKALSRRFIEEVWNKGNLDVADEIFHPGAISPDYPQLAPGPEGVKSVATAFRNAFPDFHMTFEDLLAEGDKVTGRFTETGTHKGQFQNLPPTGKQFKIGEIIILRFAGDKVVESWFQPDMLELMTQLGASLTSGSGQRHV